MCCTRQAKGRLDLVSSWALITTSIWTILSLAFPQRWTVVAYPLVVSALLKGICDYVGTYLVNYAGFGMITDLRNDLYNGMLRRSVSFFQKHTTGTLLSTLINDIERVQYAMSSVLSDFLQQFFTLIFMTAVVIGWAASWRGCCCCLFRSLFSRCGASARRAHDDATGQDKLAEIQNILHETITGNRIVKAFNMEFWEMPALPQAAGPAVPGESELGARAGDQLAADGCDWGRCDCVLLLLWVATQIQQRDDRRDSSLRLSWRCLSCTIRCGSSRPTTTAFSRRWARVGDFRVHGRAETIQEKKHAHVLKGFRDSIRLENVGFAYNEERARRKCCTDINLEIQARRGDRAGGAERGGKIDAGEFDSAIF